VIFLLVIGYARISECVLLDENTIAYWSFDEGAGDTLKDHSENGNDGVIEGAIWINGKHGSALEFNGKDAFVEVAESETLHTTDLTVTAWIKVYSEPSSWAGSNAAGIVYKHEEFQWGVENTGLLWYGIWGAALRSKYNFLDHVDEWHHVAVTFQDDNKETKIYVDGELDVEGAVGESVDSTPNRLVIGGKDEPAGPPVEELFHGAIDEVEMSSVVRKEDEIRISMGGLAVNARGKLAASWARIKIQ